MGVYRRGKRWGIQFFYQGKRIRRIVSDSKREAELILGKIKAQIAEGTFKLEKTKSPFLSSLIKKYLSYCQAHHSTRTYQGIDSVAIKEFLEFIGDIPVRSIAPFQIEEWKNSLLKKGNSKRTINRKLQTVKAMFNRAAEWDLISMNPLRHTKYFTFHKRPPRFLSKEEIQRLLEASQNYRKRDVILFLLYTGCRKGEMEKLRWEDINFEQGYIEIKKTKTKEFRRIPLHPELKKLLLERERKGDYVFGTQNNLLRDTKKVYKQAKIKNASIHTLRHTFASHLALQGVDLKTIAELLGHSSVRTTEIYAHLSPDHLKTAVDKLTFVK